MGNALPNRYLRSLPGSAAMRIVARTVCPLVLVVLSLPSRAPAQNLFFLPPTYAGSGFTVTVDLNSDGKPDLVSSDGTVQLGNGDGTFKTGTPWSVSGLNGPGVGTPFGTGDFNGDGKPDLAVSIGTFLYVLMGNGDGTFRAAISTNIGTFLGSFVVADVNRDGKPDIVASDGSSIFVFLGNGDGTFKAGQVFSPSSTAWGHLTLGDFNGDGKVDIALTPFGNTPGTIDVFLGNGDGTFASTPIGSTGVATPVAMVAGDFNGDGKLDLAVADTSTGQTFVLLGNGNGTFQAPGAPLPMVGVLAETDLNGDGKLDLVVSADPAVGIFLGNGDGTFAPKDTYSDISSQPQVASATIAIADFNSDGKSDIAVSNVLLLGNGDGSFQGSPVLPLNNQCSPSYSGLTGDFNNDGNPDVALPSNNGFCILLNDGTGKFSLANSYALPLPSLSIASGDLNGDGKLDLVFVTIDPLTLDWTLDVSLGNGDGSFGAPAAYPQGVRTAGANLIPMALVDLNGDKKPDVVVLNQYSSELNVLLGKGDGTFEAPASYFVGSRPNSFLVADFNNDGIPDFVVQSDAGLAILLGKGDGTFQPATFTASSLWLLATADLNRDGNADLICSSGGNLQVFLGNGDGTFRALPATGQLAGSGVSVIDVNGDGKLDLVQLGEVSVPLIPPPTTGVQVLLGNGDGTFGAPTQILNTVTLKSCCVVVSSILVADFNRDNRPDVAVTVFNDQTSTGGDITTVLNIAQPPAPDFLLSASSLSPAFVKPGSSAASNVALTPIGGFTGSVSLSCTGLPYGGMCTFAPAQVSGTGASALTIGTASSTPVGSYPVSITGTSSSLSHTNTITLVVATAIGATAASLAPNSLTFGPQATGTTSSPQSVELTSAGPAALTISGISIAGTNAGDFSQTNTCASAPSLAAGASCQISVTFAPTGLGPRSASLSVIDNATGSPQIVALRGTEPDFTVTALSMSTATVTPGQTATYTISLAPTGGFNQSLTLTCAGAPAQSTCTVAPSPVVFNGASARTATVTIKTTAASLGLRGPVAAGGDGRYYRVTPALRPLLLIGILVSFFMWRRSPRMRRRPACLLAALACVTLAMAACGGGSSSGGTSGIAGTQAGTYAITVSGGLTSGAATLSHSTNLTLVVQ
jgi:hypothetical protein